MAARIERMTGGNAYAGLTTRTEGGQTLWTGKIEIAPDSIWEQPLRWKRPRRIFVNSMSDMLHENVSDGLMFRFIDIVYRCPHHTFLVLTKRSARMRDFFARWFDLTGENASEFRDARGPNAVRKNHPSGRAAIFAAYLDEMLAAAGGTVPAGAAWPTFDWAGGPMYWGGFHNLWLGVSCEDQKAADARVPDLLETPAAVRFVSYEPALGPVDFTRIGAPIYTADDEGWTFSCLDTGDYYTCYEDDRPVAGPVPAHRQVRRRSLHP